MMDVLEVLGKYWGYDTFRPLQKEIIGSVAAGKDTLAILPTGGGKSICFQVPALAQSGICIVISPLIALMKDQVENLKKRNIPALLIHSGMNRANVIRTLKNASDDYFKFLYLSPERLETSLFREYLPGMNVNLIAVDEAHCISQWGYDFRPSYLRIAQLRQELPDTPVLALTASATPEVQKDICEKLELVNPQIFRQSFERKNLSYSVFRVDSKLAKLVDIVSKVPGTGIVYCKSRKRTSEIMHLLQMHGIATAHYHAGLQPEERSQRQKDWIDGRVRIMVCTNAFGMGIDKPDVRLVVHADMPDCLENYYQEAGRAGRDGQKSYAVLLFEQKDIAELNELSTARFPDLDQIRKVYMALCNFLQIPAHTPPHERYTFRFDEFIRNFNLTSHQALYALKALETDGWVEFNEKNFSPPTLVFNTSKKGLAEFEERHPEHEPVLTALLRTYEGIFDFPAFISESTLARLLRKEEAEIRKELLSITAHGIIQYVPLNEDPQLVLKKARVAATDLTLNQQLYNKRKQAFEQRVKAMTGYVTAGMCRSRNISLYFGETNPGDCGICDWCLQKRSTALSAEEFEMIRSRIVQELSQKKLSAPELLHQIKPVKKEKAWQVIEFLQAENKIIADDRGRLGLN